PVHVLICPRKHIPTLNDVTADDAELVAYMFEVARKLAEQFGVAQKGYRTVFNVNAEAGQTVFHLHLHLIGGRKLTWISQGGKARQPGFVPSPRATRRRS